MINKEAIRKVKDFPSLVDFLANELEWPIDLDVFDDIDVFAYEFTPEELGLQEQYAAKINEIKQLRPLSVEQPWSVFWVDFEPRRLPITALRRILSKFVTKKRAKRGDKVTWAKEDLLFISAQGEGQHRGITFAHFHTDEDGKEALREFSWDQTETHFHYIGGDYLESLRWPENSITPNEWRSQWRRAFSGSTRQAIRTSKDLAQMMAFLAKDMRRRVEEVFEVEAEEGPLHNLFNAFKKVLIHDLTPVDFADTYAQTITYGLFSARSMDTDGHFELHEVVDRVPNTNPFLKGFLKECLGVARNDAEGIDLDELGVVRLVELLDSLNQPDGTDVMRRILEEFGRQTRGEDPVIHFYEFFLKEYDAKKRMQRGVFYTPRSVVSFIIRSVDELLRTKFGLEDGLADTSTWGEMTERFGTLEIPEGATTDQAFVQILDPATGTGTFLVEVIDLIHKTMTEKWKREGRIEMEFPMLWNDYVPKHLLPRLHGYELMMAPYAIAHMKIGLKLYETGYRFQSDERAQVFLTNALEPAQDFSETLAFAIPALANEAEAVSAIKRDQQFTVVVGNPPYSGHSANKGKWIGDLLRDYYFVDGKPLGERNPKWLQDDYVKFIRLAQGLVSHTPLGIIGYITNHSYSDNPTFRGMRWSLLATLDDIRFSDLHGNSKKKEKCPDGSVDENVFEIQQGVAILIGIRYQCGPIHSSVQHVHLWGSRSHKYKWLSETTIAAAEFSKLSPTPPHFLFVPQDTSLRMEYEPWPRITDVLLANNMGITTGDDNHYVGFSADELLQRLGDGSKQKDYFYRPFDHRILHYDPEALARARYDFMRHMVECNNVALITIRRPRNNIPANVFVSDSLTDKCFISSLDNCQVFPLYVLGNVGSLGFSEGPSPNIETGFLDRLGSALGLAPSPYQGLPVGLTPEDVFHYTYAIFHSPKYRTRYSEFLKVDFPRFPLPGSLSVFHALARFGGELVALHLVESPKLDDHITAPVGISESPVEKVSYSDETVWIDRAKTRGFRGVPEEVWNFHIGSYQVCEKWLKDRQAKGGKNPRPSRVLTDEDINHYQKIVVALSETIRIMTEIDEVIEEHGGWPDAFKI